MELSNYNVEIESDDVEKLFWVYFFVLIIEKGREEMSGNRVREMNFREMNIGGGSWVEFHEASQLRIWRIVV